MTGARKKLLLRAAVAAVIVLALALSVLPGPDHASDTGMVLRVDNGRTISFTQMAAELVTARAVFIGELHDAPHHHRIQLEVIRALHEADVPLAVGLEMFRTEDQAGLDRWTAGRMSEPAFKRLYEQNWTLPWQLYADIFLYARDHQIPLLGLNVPEGVTRKVARSGFASLNDEDLRNLPPGIACEIDDTYMAFIRRSHGTHGTAGRSFRFFCEAQMVWDSVMAKRLADYLALNPERSVAVLAGGGHAWRRGVPARLQQFSPDLRSLVIMPLIGGKTDPGTVTTGDADFVVL